MGADGWVSLGHPRVMVPSRPATPPKDDKAHRALAAGAWVRDLGWFWLDRKAAEPQMSPPASVSNVGASHMLCCNLATVDPACTSSASGAKLRMR